MSAVCQIRADQHVTFIQSDRRGTAVLNLREFAERHLLHNTAGGSEEDEVLAGKVTEKRETEGFAGRVSGLSGEVAERNSIPFSAVFCSEIVQRLVADRTGLALNIFRQILNIHHAPGLAVLLRAALLFLRWRIPSGQILQLSLHRDRKIRE